MASGLASGFTGGGPGARHGEGNGKDPAEPMIIAQISDTHIETASATASARLGDLERTVEAINALSPRPVAVLHTGDVAHDASPGDYAAARGVLGRLACPVYAIVGNRDRRLAFSVAFGPDGYLEHGSGFVQYAVDLGPVRLVAADTLDDTSALGGFCAARAAGLTRLLDGTKGKPALVFLHHPPVALPDLKGPAVQFRDEAEAAVLTRCIGQQPDVIGVVAGHVHRARTAAMGGAQGSVMLSTMPAIAADLNREKLPAGHAGRPVFHLHRIRGREIATASVMV